MNKNPRKCSFLDFYTKDVASINVPYYVNVCMNNI